jgi:hypothetical protein
VPILRDYAYLGINGTFLAIWLAHAGFGLPLATYLLFNYISTLPREMLESAFIDGASHFTIFTRMILPLSVPALASFAIFQFLWVWNDLLVALADGSPVRGLAELSQQAVNQSVTVGVRPEALSPVSEQEGFEHGKVTQVEELGEFHLIYVQIATDHMVVAKVEGSARTRPGEAIHLSAVPEKLHFFYEKGNSSIGRDRF